jgi:hypothetical protein
MNNQTNLTWFLISSLYLYVVQTPNSPVAAGSFAGRKTNKQIILACQGATQSSLEVWIFYSVLLCKKQFTLVQ